jgi:hypothetical protein
MASLCKVVQKAFMGYCLKCKKSGGFRVSGTKKVNHIPVKTINDKMFKQLANPN